MVFDFDMVALGGAFSLPKHEVSLTYPLPDLKKALKKVQNLVGNKHVDAWGTVFGENVSKAGVAPTCCC